MAMYERINKNRLVTGDDKDNHSDSSHCAGFPNRPREAGAVFYFTRDTALRRNLRKRRSACFVVLQMFPYKTL